MCVYHHFGDNEDICKSDVVIMLNYESMNQTKHTLIQNIHRNASLISDAHTITLHAIHDIVIVYT